MGGRPVPGGPQVTALHYDFWALNLELSNVAQAGR